METNNIEFIESLIMLDGKITFSNNAAYIDSNIFGRRKTYVFDLITFECMGGNNND